MNKFLFTMIGIPAIISQSLSANAQHSFSSRKHTASNSDHAMPCRYARSAAKTTADQARVIAAAYMEYNGSGYSVTDSSALSYSNNRGSVYNDNYFTANFDSVIGYGNAGSTFDKYSKNIQTFDSHNNVLTYTEQEWISWLNNWRNSYNELNTYDAANNVLSYTSQDWDTTASAWVTTYRETNTYTAANKPATRLFENWNTSTSAWENSYRTSNAYDASNFLISTVSEMWNSSTSTWDSTYKTVYTNDASGNALTETSQMWNSSSSSWVNASRYTYTYDVSNRVLTEMMEIWNNTTSNWENNSMTTYSAYTGNSAGSVVRQGWNSATSTFVNSHRDNYTYNSYNQPTMMYDESWNATTSAWTRTAGSNYGERYHYEIYSTTPPPAATPNTIGLSGKASVYPVPAKDAISVNVTWNEPQAFRIAITDMLGRVISTSNVTECSSYTGTIPVNDLAAGNYLIKMEGANGKLVQRFVIQN